MFKLFYFVKILPRLCVNCVGYDLLYYYLVDRPVGADGFSEVIF